MANIIDILPQAKTTSTEISTKSDKESIKEKPSLFDSLLQNNVESEKKSEEKVEPKVVDKKEKELNKNEKLNVKKVADNADNNEEKAEAKNTTSLIDRLIFEAKNEVKENVETKNISSLPTKEITSQNTQTKISLDELIQENKPINESTKKESVIVSDNLDDKKDITLTTESKDKNIKEVVVDTSIKEELLNSDKKDTSLTTESKDKNIKEVVVDTSIKEELLNSEKKDTSLTTESKDKNIKEVVVDTSIKEELLSNQNNKTDIKKEKSIEDELISDNKNNAKTINNAIDEQVIDKKESKKESKVLKTNNENLIIEKSTIEIKTSDKSIIESTDVKVTKEDINNNLTINLEENNTESATENLLANIADKNPENLSSTNLSEEVDIKTLIEAEKTPQKKKTLMDLLIEKNMQNAGLKVLNEGDNLVKNELVSKDFISNMYLSEQKNLLNNQFLFNKNEALSLLKDGASLKDIEKSANILELGLDNIDIEQNVELENLGIVKRQDFDLSNKKNILDSLLNEKNIRSDDIKNLITKSVEASSALLDNSLNVSDDTVVNVNSPIAYNIHSKIIGAKQQMATMMSDIARQMYENYKPPVTVFRINLNPLELGSIAIMMKNDKNNALTISMNVSNNTTLDALVDNQNVLRNSLNKTFDENTKFNLDFSSSNQNNNQSSNNQNNQNSQYQERRFEKQMDTQSVLQLTEENKDREEKLDYM
ncbi:flagellar hook-length control protein FliK [Arcobacter defluvii]|uniref:Flagellar hook-length control protein FliK n=1 Tax=Arcobacter defluvii TaxID=873191 RepID=A0AAE7E823_9BACT|nr:flagellar hook-length control protein FliK [Arcobacter defluvii]QKF78469.1 flagellar hook-length control protein FliK [Arcobacter defluvii]RXI31335.1 flagellar hook-length control protein FliK [Arcobacter defluvii]